MKILTTFIFATLVGSIGFAYSGLYDVSARTPHSGIVNWLLSTVSHASIERRAHKVQVPDLSNENLKLAGANDFATMCAACHGAPGQSPEAVGQGLNPAPPDLAKSAVHMSTAELFWVTKHGIKMTGMPAWGATHNDAALWPVVTFMTILPELDAAAYQKFLASAKGLGHHIGDGKVSNTHIHDQTPQQPAENHTDHHH
ncbi:MAG: cytochrome c [Pseudomonadales bacterium]